MQTYVGYPRVSLNLLFVMTPVHESSGTSATWNGIRDVIFETNFVLASMITASVNALDASSAWQFLKWTEILVSVMEIKTNFIPVNLVVQTLIAWHRLPKFGWLQKLLEKMPPWSKQCQKCSRIQTKESWINHCQRKSLMTNTMGLNVCVKKFNRQVAISRDHWQIKSNVRAHEKYVAKSKIYPGVNLAITIQKNNGS